MMDDDETLYLHRRAAQEQQRAEAAADRSAATIHRQLADHYRHRAARLVLPHVPVRS